MLLIKRGVSGSFRQGMFGMDVPRDLITKENKIKKKYKEIRKRLDSGKEAEYKIAILEADRIIDEMLRKMKYEGENLGERLANIVPGQLLCLEDLKSAHEIANNIVHDDNFQISSELAKETLDKFEKLLTEFE